MDCQIVRNFCNPGYGWNVLTKFSKRRTGYLKRLWVLGKVQLSRNISLIPESYRSTTRIWWELKIEKHSCFDVGSVKTIRISITKEISLVSSTSRTTFSPYGTYLPSNSFLFLDNSAFFPYRTTIEAAKPCSPEFRQNWSVCWCLRNSHVAHP